MRACNLCPFFHYEPARVEKLGAAIAGEPGQREAGAREGGYQSCGMWLSAATLAAYEYYISII
jgi:hypothetical protein